MTRSIDEAARVAATELTREEKLALLKQRLAQAGGAADRIAPVAAAPHGARLSAAQRRLWDLEEQMSSNLVHVFALAYYVNGPLDAAVLAEAIGAVARRHPALRARIADARAGGRRVDGQPYFEDAPPPPLERRSIAFDGDIDRDAQLEVVLRAGAETPLDPAEGAGWRAILIEYGREAHALLVQFHHIFADRWSVGIFMTDLGTAYRNVHAGRPPFDSDVPQPESPGDDDAGRQLAWWRIHFATAAPQLRFPVTHRADAFAEYRGARIESAIAADAVAPMKTLAADEGTTLFPLLLAAFAATLHAHTGQEELVLCTPMVGRHRAGTRGVIGYFNNIVPLRLDLRGDPTFRELVARVTAEGRDAYAHQDAPFHAIAELPELAAARITRCLFAVQNIPGLRLDLPGLTTRYRDVPNGTANFDLSLFLEEKDGRLELLLDHKTAVVDGAAAATLAERFGEIARAMAAQPDQRLSALPRYPRAEHPAQVATGAAVDERRYAALAVLEARMVDVWKPLFPGAEVHAESHFFAMGGDSMRAARLFTRIEQAFGHELPHAALLEAPTPRQLVRKMASEDWVVTWLSLVPVKASGTRAPLFVVHGGGGGVLTFKWLADCLHADQPMYCLQAIGLRSGERPRDTVEDMARHYLASVRHLRSRGPYLLAGHSLGAAVAYEMAQQLVADGERVAFVGLFDHPGPAIKLGRTDWLRYRWLHLSTLPPGDRAAYIWRGLLWRSRLPIVAHRLRVKIGRIAQPSAKPPWSGTALHEQGLRALRAYQIKPYPGRLSLFRAKHGSPRIHADALGGWDGVAAGGVEVHEVPGTHNGMLLQPAVQALGAALSRCLQQLEG